MLFNREPALFLGAVHALIALAIGFGLHITTEQFALIETAVTTIVSFWVRSKVYAPVDANGKPILVSSSGGKL